jgi:hypothetical protein
MLKWLIRRKLAAFERERGYDASYMRELLDTDLRAFLKFARAVGIGEYRKDVPLEVYFAAGITSSIAADCGPCTQLGVGFAIEAGVAPAIVAAIVAGDEAAMPREALVGARFARAVLARDPEADVWREEVARRWGPRAVVALAFAILNAQMYPTIKYALGYGKACTRVVVDGKTIAPHRSAPVAAANVATTSQVA